MLQYKIKITCLATILQHKKIKLILFNIFISNNNKQSLNTLYNI